MEIPNKKTWFQLGVFNIRVKGLYHIYDYLLVCRYVHTSLIDLSVHMYDMCIIHVQYVYDLDIIVISIMCM